MEEYKTLLHCPRILVDKAYSRAANAPTFVKKLMSITGMSELTARIQQKGDGKCIPWVIMRDLILAHLDVGKKVDIFALSIYGLMIFPKALKHIDKAVTDLFDHLDKKITPALLEGGQELFGWSQMRSVISVGVLIIASNRNLGAIGYTSLLALRQYKSRQIIPATYGLAQCEFST
ncbi:UDP-glycosyltransferase 91C1-like [Gossypium australe]|uniref:UDP-glycosyltransferase 91C1-like n=1 Tax=Gossypium australe TaxID=47621 RepID=A0A5B6TZW9_9ROSI|nr:UDP-glycosyltransferase 91C1-like [Gossypium australe]